MPLLGRHKTTTSPSGPANQPPQRPGQQASQAAKAPLLCDSPMFGIRKQIVSQQASGDQQPASSSTATGELSSVPQQITRQQIHYAFSIMDNNNDGLIDLRDLSQMLANLGVPIDEAILSHVMSSASKRGDHRISELEFLDWIGHFVQVSSDVVEPKDSAGSRPARRAASTRAGSALLSSGPSEGRTRDRRGSGSGLALMRSLSSASSSSSSSSSAPTRPLPEAELEQARELSELEAKNDLKAAFCVFDLDGDGFITLDEVQAGLRLLGETWSQAELRQLFERCHRQDQRLAEQQRISIDDFVKLLL